MSAETQATPFGLIISTTRWRFWMKKRLIIGLTVGLLTLATSVPAFAHDGGHVGGPGGGALPTEENAIVFVCEEATVAVDATGTNACEAD